jgi:hypothetical protein
LNGRPGDLQKDGGSAEWQLGSDDFEEAIKVVSVSGFQVKADNG